MESDQKMNRIRRSIMSWPMCVPLSQYEDITDIVDVDSLKELGKGMFGAVFEANLLHDAYDLSVGAPIALKEMDIKNGWRTS